VVLGSLVNYSKLPLHSLRVGRRDCGGESAFAQALEPMTTSNKVVAAIQALWKRWNGNWDAFLDAGVHIESCLQRLEGAAAEDRVQHTIEVFEESRRSLFSCVEQGRDIVAEFAKQQERVISSNDTLSNEVSATLYETIAAQTAMVEQELQMQETALQSLQSPESDLGEVQTALTMLKAR